MPTRNSVLKYSIFSMFCFLSVMSSEIFADGKYFPAKAYRTSPTIHSQRAILKYKDGQETLVIESSFDGEGQEFGWVIPLPAKPTNFEEASSGFLQTLSVTVQPNIIHDVTGGFTYIFGMTGIAGVFFILTLFVNSKRNIFKLFLLFVLLFSLGISVFMPALGKAGGGGTSSGRRGIHVLNVQEVGSFGLVVLEADNAQALDGWLTDNGFTNLNNTERQIASEYIEEGWCFVAAKLKRDGKGYTEPHPLAMTFKVEKPIYPMRLTSAADSRVFLELFVIADNYATSPALTVEHTSRYSYDPNIRNNKPGYKSWYSVIGHPDKDKYMWDKCVITRLCDVLGPEDMKDDIIVESKDGKDFQKKYFSRKGAFDTGLIVGLLGWMCAIIVLSFLTGNKKNLPLNWKGKIKKVFLPATCLLLMSWVTGYLIADKIDVSVVQKGGWIVEHMHEIKVEGLIDSMIFDGVFSDCTNIEALEKKLKEEVFPEIKKEIKFEDSPGNVTVLKDDRGFVVRLYQRGGFYKDIVLTDQKISK